MKIKTLYELIKIYFICNSYKVYYKKNIYKLHKILNNFIYYK